MANCSSNRFMILHLLEQEVVGTCLPLSAPMDPSACLISGMAACLIVHLFRPIVVTFYCMLY